MWGMGDVNQELKVLYNVQKGIVQYQENEKNVGGGGGEGGRGQYLNPKHSLCI